MVWTNTEAPILIKGSRVADNGANRTQAIVSEDCVDEEGVGIREHSNIDAIGTQPQDFIFQTRLYLDSIQAILGKMPEQWGNVKQF